MTAALVVAGQLQHVQRLEAVQSNCFLQRDSWQVRTEDCLGRYHVLGKGFSGWASEAGRAMKWSVRVNLGWNIQVEDSIVFCI